MIANTQWLIAGEAKILLLVKQSNRPPHSGFTVARPALGEEKEGGEGGGGGLCSGAVQRTFS